MLNRILTVVMLSLFLGSAVVAENRPNIVFILADDMGRDSIQANNTEFKVPTPCLDRLVSEGINFTDAHSGSSVCTPTRYGLLTGRHCWRTPSKFSVLWDWYPSLIEPQRLTLPEMLKAQGYRTAMVGKWHLGMDWELKESGFIRDALDWHEHDFTASNKNRKTKDFDWKRIDFSKPFRGGPTDHGFDYFFGLDLPNFPPYTWMEQDRVLEIPTILREQSVYKTGKTGPATKDFDPVKILPRLTQEAVGYLEKAATSKQPFFLYVPLTSPHAPIAPSERFLGKSGVNPYADFIMQTDWSAGEIIKAIDRSGLKDNTIVIFSTDNGSTRDGIRSIKNDGGGRLDNQVRGGKTEIFEGGHRVPFILRWPGKAPAGSICEETFCLTDMMATFAELTGYRLADGDAVDSHSVLPLFSGGQRERTPSVIHHSIKGELSIREGNYKLLFFYKNRAERTDLTAELYDLSRDQREEENILPEHPEIGKRLSETLQTIIREGRSTPGPNQKDSVNPFWDPAQFSL
ncbi:sulfatase-like hydrolase/transferase [Pontiella sulfatireligans]|uniref:Arylsulfatase n=1 Tax=Pontiella sulfatireligans TaxID=2750658 RepID=A0A6C2UNN2_9BACT|nr:sulfatase-like hydrolase/transferase [Pontiella sulfatireligans]SPS74467.1 sulfatase S1_15 [Kiritimatiellales bacterium]VGO21890.1 Arylsulfatase [Pontiella sulfatireligans]